MSDNNKKILANLIKADLKNALESDSRMGEGWYFQDYKLINDKIWVDWKNLDNKEIEKAVRENSQRNFSKRKEKDEEEIREYERKGGKTWPLGLLKFELIEREIWPDELEKEDYDEIVSLIQQAEQLKKQKNQQWIQERDEKLASDSRLFYWGGGKRGITGHFSPSKDCSPKWESRRGKGYHSFLRKENGKECWVLEIDPNHPVLDNFSFEKPGFYLISGIENFPFEPCSYNGTPCSSRDNFYKFVESKDNITIIPYKVDDIHTDNKPPTSTNSALNIFEKETDKYLNSNKSVKDLHISFLLNFFKSWNIKSIELTNPSDIFSDLIIIYNDGKREILNYAAPDGDESNIIRRSLKIINEKSLDQQKLEKFRTNSYEDTTLPTNSSKPDYVPYLIGGTVVVFVLVVFWIGYRLRRSQKNK